eukprot:CAMPEP_0117421510 /NCGR_PEP_ID=MMETSP0758-20121206/2577_1 /TAXON_ID=63605 /ORGANISM="Percolomonas cosmopolitus, Strain AE-1 (ATCC 50343)" /LENGTH=435 /DNA_ID=CAMNT_0005203657 /DNA_START=339 /DNA_END=1643 /DNA_ORIENTATION=-
MEKIVEEIKMWDSIIKELPQNLEENLQENLEKWNLKDINDDLKEQDKLKEYKTKNLQLFVSLSSEVENKISEIENLIQRIEFIKDTKKDFKKTYEDFQKEEIQAYIKKQIIELKKYEENPNNAIDIIKSLSKLKNEGYKIPLDENVDICFKLMMNQVWTKEIIDFKKFKDMNSLKEYFKLTQIEKKGSKHNFYLTSDEKFIFKSFDISDKDQEAKNIIRGTEALMKISAKQVINIKGIYFSETHIFKKMPYYDKGDLSVIKELTIDEFFKIGIELFYALASIHFADIIHFDIKPANILLNEKKDIILADFDLSITTESMKYVNENSLHLRGSKNYIDPRLIDSGRNASKKCDIYSAGMVLEYLFKKISEDEKKKLTNDDEKKVEEIIKNCTHRDQIERDPAFRVFKKLGDIYGSKMKTLNCQLQDASCTDYPTNW